MSVFLDHLRPPFSLLADGQNRAILQNPKQARAWIAKMHGLRRFKEIEIMVQPNASVSVMHSNVKVALYNTVLAPYTAKASIEAARPTLAGVTAHGDILALWSVPPDKRSEFAWVEAENKRLAAAVGGYPGRWPLARFFPLPWAILGAERQSPRLKVLANPWADEFADSLSPLAKAPALAAPGTCRNPVGEGVCGKPAMPGSAYCPDCYRATHRVHIRKAICRPISLPPRRDQRPTLTVRVLPTEATIHVRSMAA